MKCELCNKKEAQQEIIEIVNNKRMTKSVCNNCAKLYQFSSFDNYVNSYVKKPEGAADVIECPKCHTTLRGAMANKQFGCEYCFIHFKDFINKMLDGKVHKGRAPIMKHTKLSDSMSLSEINVKIKEAVLKEDFEEAARLKSLREDLINGK